MSFKLNRHTALISIDFQTDVFTDGPLKIVGASEVLPKAKLVLAAARQAKLPIIHTKEVHRKEMVDFGVIVDAKEKNKLLELNARF